MSGHASSPAVPVWSEAQAVPFVWAHRGASALAPENTVEAFLLASDLGAPGVELDVQMTRDGIPVVLHDPFLWSDGNRLVLRRFSDDLGPLRRVSLADLDWKEIAGIPVLHHSGLSAPVPRFEEVLEAVPAALWVDVELKAGWRDDPRLVGAALSCIARRPERVLVSSFDHLVLKQVATAAPELPVLAICHARLVDAQGLCATIPAAMICVDRPFLTESDVRRWRDEGLEVSSGGPEVADDLEQVMSWPLSGIFLDDPRLAIPARTTATAPDPS